MLGPAPDSTELNHVHKLSVLALLTVFAAPALEAAPVSYSLVTTHTDAVFEISHAGYSMKHGWFRNVTGTMSYDADKIEASTVDVTIKADSIDTNHAPRDKDLTGPGFLDAAKYPELHFVSTKVTRTGDSTLDVDGNFSLHGVTRPLLLHVKLNRSGPSPFSHAPTLGFTATGTFQRSDFGMTTMIPLIGDAVSITIDTEFAAAPT